MAEFRMTTDNVGRRAESLLKSVAESKSAGEALSWNFDQENRLQNLVNMSWAAERYGAKDGLCTMLLIDVEDAKALDFF